MSDTNCIFFICLSACVEGILNNYIGRAEYMTLQAISIVNRVLT